MLPLQSTEEKRTGFGLGFGLGRGRERRDETFRITLGGERGVGWGGVGEG